MVYCVEDDASIRELALYALTQAGIEAEGMANDVEFRAACARRLPDVVMLDIMLPGADGLEILHRIRNTPGLSRVPLIMVTAKSTELDIVTALDGGADEYLTKPYGMMEMVSRVRALLRRAPDWGSEAPQGSSDEITVGPLSISEMRHEAFCGGEPLSLTSREFDLLLHFMENPGVALSRDALLQHVWGWDFAGGSRTVDMHVLTLRQKLGDMLPHRDSARGGVSPRLAIAGFGARLGRADPYVGGVFSAISNEKPCRDVGLVLDSPVYEIVCFFHRSIPRLSVRGGMALKYRARFWGV